MAESMLENIPDGGDIFLIQGPLTDNNVSLIREGIDERPWPAAISMWSMKPTALAGLRKTPIPIRRKD